MAVTQTCRFLTPTSAEGRSPAGSTWSLRSPLPRNHLSEIYQIPTLRQEKKCFIYKPIRVFADNCECQILGRDDEVQRLPGPELGPKGGGLLGCPTTSILPRGGPWGRGGRGGEALASNCPQSN